jgi:hypothetical protein
MVADWSARADWNPDDPYKWLQLPDETTNGIDVEMTAPFELADDFLCTNTGPITDLHLWVSWQGDRLPQDPRSVSFNISFWSDQPAGPAGEHSQPDKLLWQTNMSFTNYTFRLWKNVADGEGWLTPPDLYAWPADQQIWQYNFFFDRTNAFVQDGTPEEPKTNWVVVSAIIEEPGCFIGWKTSTSHWNDDAVWRLPQVPWAELRYPPMHPYAGESIDLAFVITSEAEELLDYGDAPDQPYPTLLVNDGARHVPTGPWLGPAGDNPDDEPDGQPNSTATGDDNDIAAPANPPPNYDDENGVIIPPLVPGTVANLQIIVSDPAGGMPIVDGWIDFNGNGVWESSALEYVIPSVSFPIGTNIFPVSVPAGIGLTNTYARFRISTAGGLSPTGYSADGEVEDYEVKIQEEEQPMDYGDAPDQPYPTLYVSNGARHIITPTGPWLGPVGDNPDDEPDGQPNSAATGDDNDIAAPINPPPNYDDENGVIIPVLVPGTTVTLQIIVSDPGGVGGAVDGWIDFNANGAWELAEQVVAASFPVGTNPFNVVVPAGLTTTNTYARFRISSAGGLSTTGLAQDGEVEDYEVKIQEEVELLDFGDAPDSPLAPGYPTLLMNNGARHLIVAGGPWLGGAADNPDDEPDGQPNATATGDDLDTGPGNPLPNYDDENGVVFLTPLVPGFNASVQVTLTGVGVLNGWVDFNADGSWAQTNDYILPNLPLGPGTVTLYFTVPAGATITNRTYARFRYTSLPLLPGPTNYAGLAPDGEVEDYTVAIERGPEPLPDFDFGDAPDGPYPTLLPNGARHIAYLGFCLGTNIDTEPDGQPHPLARGDDLMGVTDDEDGVTFTTPLRRGSNACVEVVLTSSLSFGRLDAWIDFDHSGVWGDTVGEKIFSDLPVSPGTNTGLCFPVPASAVLTNTFARFRLSSLGGLSPTNLASNGEVEDYEVHICQTAPSTNVVFTGITVTNVGTQQVVTLTWNAETNVLYQMLKAITLSNVPPVWTNAGPAVLGPTNLMVLTNTTVLERYYRIMVPDVCP